MADATPHANGDMPDAESARWVNPSQDPDDASGTGITAAEEMTVVPQSDLASAWPGWPGVVRPAGWFPSASGEAAPPVWSGTEPARTDAAQPEPGDESRRPG